LLTVRGATLQIFATCPVVKTFIAGSPILLSLCPTARLDSLNRSQAFNPMRLTRPFLSVLLGGCG
jgi:hypothetical protein